MTAKIRDCVLQASRIAPCLSVQPLQSKGIDTTP